MDVISGELPSGRVQMLSCHPASDSPLPPRDAWNSLGKMSRGEAMSAYISEMKLVAQKVVRAVALSP